MGKLSSTATQGARVRDPGLTASPEPSKPRSGLGQGVKKGAPGRARNRPLKAGLTCHGFGPVKILGGSHHSGGHLAGISGIKNIFEMLSARGIYDMGDGTPVPGFAFFCFHPGQGSQARGSKGAAAGRGKAGRGTRSLRSKAWMGRGYIFSLSEIFWLWLSKWYLDNKLHFTNKTIGAIIIKRLPLPAILGAYIFKNLLIIPPNWRFFRFQ
jgi:hypothetical protein